MVMKDTMCGKIMMERVDSVTDSEKVAMNVVYKMKNREGVLAEVEREWG